MSKGRTYESRPVPGSEDALHPLAWAERLFNLKELRKDFKPSEEPSPVLMGFLEKYGMGPTTKPVEFPDGLPTTQEDLLNFRLLPNGKFVRKGKSPFRRGSYLDLSSESALENCRKISSSVEQNQLTPVDSNAKYLSRDYLRQWHNKRWERHQLFSEFFTPHYKYRLNQDGQEYRYSGLWRLDDAMRQSIKQRLNPDGTYKARNNSRFEADWNTYPWAFY
ncbi:39S ribosomal protein L30, mitochondrial [Sparganum proliferum]